MKIPSTATVARISSARPAISSWAGRPAPHRSRIRSTARTRRGCTKAADDMAATVGPRRGPGDADNPTSEGGGPPKDPSGEGLAAVARPFRLVASPPAPRPKGRMTPSPALESAATIVPGHPDYDEARSAWNLAADQRPAAIVIARS